MSTIAFIVRLIGGLVFMAVISAAAVIVFALEIIWEIASALWFFAASAWSVLVAGSVRKF